MNITDNIYSNSDKEYREVREFLNTLSDQDPYMLWESTRMNFVRYNLHAGKDDQFFKDNVHIWRLDNQEIIGICISEYGKNDLFIEVRPEYHNIYPDILHWIENTWAINKETVEIELYGEDTQKIKHLEVAGYSFLRHTENKREYNLDNVNLEYNLKEGFIIQAFSESHDYASRVALVQSAFNNPNYTIKNLNGCIASPDYIDEYNLVVVSLDKQHVAYCVGWHQQGVEHCGCIEPVGTHAAYRQRGFAKAVIRECFSRMKSNGIKTVKIASGAEPKVSNFLYDSLSPETKREVHRYGKNVLQG